jgi:NAD(P)-dependent dehydrogenase (short-subunit alcohol dehydrogenase family)
MPDSLRDRQIILAGGSGGLGAVSARRLTTEGAVVVASYHTNANRANALVDVATLVKADLTVAADRARLLDAAPSLYGLVVFAGDASRVQSPQDFERMMHHSYESNYLGPILLAREAAARMREAKTPGALVLFSTMQAEAVFPNSTVYSAPKAALVHAALVLAKECRGAANIRVNVVSPGVTAAGMAEASIASGKYDSYLRDGVIPRFGRAEDVARAVRFFLEPDNYVTGQVLTVDGGLTL